MKTLSEHLQNPTAKSLKPRLNRDPLNTYTRLPTIHAWQLIFLGDFLSFLISETVFFEMHLEMFFAFIIK